MTNKEYMANVAHAFPVFVANNYAEFKKDPEYMLRSLERVAHDIGAGIRKDGTECEVISGSYSSVLVSAFFGSSVGIPVDAKTWSGWLYDRVGAAYATNKQ